MNKTCSHALVVLAMLLLIPTVPAIATSPAETTEATKDRVETPVDALALVNGESIFAEDVERLLGVIHKSTGPKERAEFDLERAMFRLVNDTLIGQEARAMGMAEEPEIAKKIEAYRDELALTYFERDAFEGQVEPTDEQVAALFGEQYRMVQLRVVSSYDEAGAETMLAELREGADMDSLARERSVDPVAIRGGLMKPAPRIDLQLEVAEKAFTMEVGEVAGPVRTNLGWVVFRIEAFEDADPARFEAVEPTLRALLRKEKLKQLRAELIGKARKHHEVRINHEVVDAIKPKRMPDARLIPDIPEPQAVVLTVGDRVVTARDYGRALIARWKGVRNEEAAVVSAPIILQSIIQRELLLAEALRTKADEFPAVQHRLHARETQLLVEHYLEEVLSPRVEVDTKEMQSYYDEHKNQFLRPPRVRLGQITVETLEEAQRVAGLLSEGADLGWLAERHSIDGFKATGGDRGWYEPRPGVDPFNDNLLAAEVGDVLDPFGTPGTFLVVKVLAREEQGPYPYDEVSGNVRNAVYQKKLLEEIDRYITVLRSRSEIEVYEDRLKRLQIVGSVEEQHGAGGTASGHGH